MLIIGLTGGIGSGKTTVAHLFAAHGVPVIDTDEIARQLTQPGQDLLQAIQQQFGDKFFSPDGSLNRAALASRVFNNPQARKQLEAILHPAIRKEVDHQVKHLEAPYCLLVIPLLIETKQQERVDRILVVDTTESLQLDRTRQRDQRSEDEIRVIMQAQIDRQTRLSYADDIIDNSDTTSSSLDEQVNMLHQKYLHLARQKHP